MADNVPVTTGSGISIGADEITGVKYQRIKLIHGADGVNAGDVASGNPLPVTGSTSILNVVSVTGSTAIVNTPTVTGSVAIVNTPSVTIPAITGSVAIVNTPAVTIPAVTGSVAVVNTVSVTGSTAVVNSITVGSIPAITGSVAVVNTVAITGSAAVVNTVAVTGSTSIAANVLPTAGGFGSGNQSVATSGTALTIGAATCKYVYIVANTDNSGVISIGGSGTSAITGGQNGILLYAGASTGKLEASLPDIFINSSESGDGVAYAYVT